MKRVFSRMGTLWKASLPGLRRMGLVELALPGLLLLLLCGCSALIPTEHKEQVAVKTAGELAAAHSVELRKAVTAPPVTVRASGFSHVDMKMEAPKGPSGSGAATGVIEAKESDTQEASGKDSAQGSTWTKIPLGFKLLLLAAGLAALGFVLQWGWKWVKGNSAAASAGWDYLDSYLAEKIHGKTTEAMQTTDPQAQARLNAEIAQLEKERGKAGS